MKKFHIHTNCVKDPKNVCTDEIKCTIEGLGGTVLETSEGAEAMIAIGGDGTLLRAVHEHPDLPVIGINLGTLGFLTEFEAHDKESLKKIINGDFVIQSRMMLEASVDGGESVFALNDVVLTRGTYSGIMTMDLEVDGSLADVYYADGIIASTPTGAMAYALSAGGPVVEPDIELIGVTPICPHSMRARSIMISHNRNVKIRLREREGARMVVSCDGNIIGEIGGGSAVSIKRADRRVKFVKLKGYSFYDVLRDKKLDPM